MKNATAPTTGTRLASRAAVQAMRAPIVHCSPETPLSEAARIMSERRIHCVATSGVSRDQTRGLHLVWGIVTDLDLVRAAALADDADIDVGRAATREVVTVEPTDTLDVVARVMSDYEVQHVIVVAEDEPIGVISTLDLAAAIADES